MKRVVLGGVVAVAALAAASPSTGDPTLALRSAVRWQSGQPGVEWAELPVASLKLVLARIDPAMVRLDLAWGLDPDAYRPNWTIAQAGDALVAFNAGMFVDALPWGWVVLDGHERLAPGKGPLSSALIGLRDGSLAWVDGDDVAEWRGRRDVAFAFQSFPTLLTAGGNVPAALTAPGTINLIHRDARLAIGLDRDGKLLVVLTRFDVDVAGLDRIPFGLTVPEMAAVMGSLGAQRAMLLDGGISAQMALRDSSGIAHQWPGIRKVPLALVGTTR